MSKQSKKKWLSITAALMMATPIIQLSQPTAVHAVADTFTLTKSGNDKIVVSLNGTPQVQLPDGNIVSTNYTFTAKRNMTYTFVGIDGAVRHQKSITMTTVPNANDVLVVAPGESVKLNFESGDAHSGVKDMRYKVYNEASGESSASYTAWESFKAEKPYTVPSIPVNTNSNWIVKAEFRDVAGNVASNVISRFIVENWAPSVNISQTTRYTNNRNINVRAVGLTKFADPLEAKVGTASGSFDRTYNLTTASNLFTGTNNGDDRNFIYNLPYTLPDVEKEHTLYYQMSKKQNNQTLNSPVVTTKVMYDKTAPTGTVIINNNEDFVPSREVKLTIDTSDTLSGVEKVIVREVGASASKMIEIKDPSPREVRTWVFDMNETGQIEMVVTDRAGNTDVITSKIVRFAKLNINTIELTQNRNPLVYNKSNPFETKSDWDGGDEIMLSGSNFEFGVGYDMGVANTADYTVTGTYVMEVEKDGVTHYKTEATNFAPKVGMIDRFESGKVNIPENMPEGADVFVTISLRSVNKMNKAIVMNESTGKRQFGKIGEKNLDEAVNEKIRFNEVN